MPDTPENPAVPSNSPQPYTPPPVPPPIAVPPPKSGPSALKIVLIILAVLFGLALVGAGILGYGVWRVAKSLRKDANGNVTISTSKGTITANSSEKFTASDLGIAIYPGAEQQKGSLRIAMGDKTMISANFLTSDSMDQVVAFYKEQAGPTAQANVSSNTAQFVVATNTGDAVTVTIMPNPGADGKTRISIIRAPKASASN